MSLEILFFSFLCQYLHIFTNGSRSHPFHTRASTTCFPRSFIWISLWYDEREENAEKRIWNLFLYFVVCFHSLLFTVNQEDMCAMLFSSILFHLYFCYLLLPNTWYETVERRLCNITISTEYDFRFILHSLIMIPITAEVTAGTNDQVKLECSFSLNGGSSSTELDLFNFSISHTLATRRSREREKELWTYITNNSDNGNNILKVVLFADTQRRKKEARSRYFRGTHKRISVDSGCSNKRDGRSWEGEMCVISSFKIPCMMEEMFEFFIGELFFSASPFFNPTSLLPLQCLFYPSKRMRSLRSITWME